MKLRPKYSTVWLTLAWWLCAGSLLVAGEYEKLFGRSLAQRRGATHARMTVDLLFLGRSGVRAHDIVYSVPLDDDGEIISVTPLLNTSDLELDAAVSGRYDLILSDDTPYELQFTLTGFPNFHKVEVTRTDPDIRASLFGLSSRPGPFSDPDAPTDTFKTRYASKFGSGEINLRHRLGPSVTVFSGFRHIALQEDIDFISRETSEGFEDVSANADNAYYGIQIGAESTVWTNGRVRIDVIGRTGVFLNHIEVGLNATLEDEPFNPERKSDKTAFASDLQATLFIPLGPGSLRLGYQMFWVNKAALVPNQLDSINFSPTATNPGTFDLSSPIYHGGFLGLEVPF